MAPSAFLFDVNETLLDVAALDGPVFDGDRARREAWFGQLVQSALLTTLLGGYRPFGELATAALAMTAPGADPDVLSERLASLPAHPDVEPALRALRDAGVRCAALTQSKPEVLERQLAAAGLSEHFEGAFSAHDAGRLKPAPEPYRLAIERLGLQPAEVTMVAAHTWDVAGAAAAGLGTVLVTRFGVVPDPSQPAPGSVVSDLVELVGLEPRTGDGHR